MLGLRLGLGFIVIRVRFRIMRTGREVERKRKKCEEKINTTKGQNVFIRFKIEKTKKKPTN